MASTHRCTPSSASHRKPSLVRSICSRQCECPPGTTSKSIRPSRSMPTSLYPQVLVSTASSIRQKLRNKRLLQVSRSRLTDVRRLVSRSAVCPVHLPQMRNPAVHSTIASCRRAQPFFLFNLLLSFCALALLFVSAPHPAHAQSKAQGHLLIYSIDVEGGQSTLLVAPSGASLLVDTGWPNPDGRDAVRRSEERRGGEEGRSR